MTELCALVGRHLREMTRGRLARTALVLFVIGIALAAWLGARSEQAAALMLLSAVLVLTLLVAGASLGAGGVLPEDRVAGREEWLATLSPPAWKRRLSAALAGWLLAMGLGLVGGLVAGASVALLRSDVELRSSLPLEGAIPEFLPDAVVLPADALSGEPRCTLELDVRPRFRSMHAAVDRVEVWWKTEGGEDTVREVSVRGPLRIELGPDSRAVALDVVTRGVELRVTGARILGAAVSPVLSLALAGLLLGLLVGCVAPVAVLISRRTTGQTAAAAACCLLLYGAVKGALLTFAGDLALGNAGVVASGVLRGVGLLAPDAPLLGVLTETAAFRAATPGGLSVALPALLYGAVALALVALPAPRRFTEGTNA